MTSLSTMTEGDLHIAWLVSAPICLLTDILAVLVVCHFRSYLHGTDIVVISLIVSMAANVAVLIPLPAALGLTEETWTADLCRFYIWFFVMLRVVQLVHTTMLSVHWVSVLKLSSQKSNFSSTFSVKMSVPITWVLAGIVGLLPIIGDVPNDFSHQGQCKYFVFDLSVGLGIFMIIFSLVCIITSLCSAIDAMVILQYVRRVAARKYGTANLYIPKKEPEIAGGYTIHERYSQLNFACDMCRLILVTIATSYCINHMPYLVMQFLQISGQGNRELFQHIMLSLTLVESLVIPHILWLTDPSSCTLQSYKRRIKRNSVTTNLNPSEVSVQRSPTSASRDVQAKLRPTSGTSEYAEIHKQGTNGETERPTSSDITVTTVDLLNVGSIKNIDQKMYARDLKRSLSGSSRNEWKEQMRKKHLPAIFVNEAFDSTDVSSVRGGVEQPKPPVKQDMDNSSLHSMYYYMSSDYHPDYLNTDSLPRHAHIQIHKSEVADCLELAKEHRKEISAKTQQRNYHTSEHLYRARMHDYPTENR
ncbi:hypothetical protein FSP39_020243 [Pinctada imbricata]|uniref:G-protein coupled receptors family 1 profile domain-containing protein n=1 Tax=Pinctada imbricata TaxID=66713 RepID=A0AA88YP53_PINIB|nr:hypothetical protein FSP39_020243 [Pinctada imbricata]